MRRRIALALLCTAAAPLTAQQPDLAGITDTVFARWNSTHSPGCAVGIARDGQVLLTRGYGMANLEGGTPNTGETIMESGSVAKQFTATAVVLLALDGKLKLDDPVRKYLPEMPAYDRPILIRHLLTHTSGLREWSSLVAAAGWPRGSRAHTQADLLDVVYRQKALNYPVGDYYSYTNSGYAVAMSLVEHVSGKKFQDFSQERIFRPLGMTHTQWRDDFTRIVPGRAQAYSRADDGWRLEMPFESVVGPGGLLTTAGDWLKWNEALAHNTLFPGHRDTLTHQMRLSSGRDISYALGVVVGSYRGVKEVSHSGSTAGYSTYLARFPDRSNLSIAVLCNAAGAPAGLHAHQIADRLITDFPRAASLDTSRIDVTALAPYYGIYRDDRTHGVVEVNGASVERMRALPDGNFWMMNGARWRLDRTAAGKPAGFFHVSSDGDTSHYTYVGEKFWSPSPAQLRAFEGSYHSDEVGATFQVQVVGDSLTARVRPGAVTTLRPTYSDGFTTDGTAVWFTRDRNGKVTAMHLGESRMWDLVVPRLTSANGK